MGILKLILLSVTFATLFFWAIKINHHKTRCWILLLFGVLPVIFIYIGNPDFRVYDWHGFMHGSIVYQIVNGNIPPNNPLLAEQPLLYPWGSHFMVAKIVSLFDISPATVFALINLCFLVLTLVLVYKISVFLYSERIAGVFAAFLSIFGITFFHRGPVSVLLERIDSLVDMRLFRMDRRTIPVLSKFVGSGATNQAGILLFALFIYSVLQIFSNQKTIKLYYATIFMSALGTAFFYPLYLPALAASTFACCLVMYMQQGKAVLTRIIYLTICVVLGMAAMLPYLHQITTGKTKAAAITLALWNPQHLLTNGLTYIVTVLPVFIVLVWGRNALLNKFRTTTSSTLIMIAVVATTAIMWIGIISPTRIEYKYLILSCLTLGIFSSFCLRELYLKKRIICFILISSFLLPLSSFMLFDTGQLPITDKYIEKGMYLIHQDPDENALYSYISSQTKPDAVFVDSYLTIPVFGRRQLYIGLDTRRENFDRPMSDGWTSTAERLLHEQGYLSEITDVRRRVATEIYSKNHSQISANILAELQKISSDLYVVSRDKKTKEKLINDKHFSKVFETKELGIYKFFG